MSDIILQVNAQTESGSEGFVNLISALLHHQKVTLMAIDHRSGQSGYVQVEVL